MGRLGLKEVQEIYLPLTEVNSFGEIQLGKIANETARRAILTCSKAFDAGMGASFTVKFDTGAFEQPPTFTFDVGENGPRLYLHGTHGELTHVIEIMDDGSTRIETHE